MTGRSIRLTDETLRRALVELAGEPDAGALLNDVIRAVDVQPQAQRLPWALPSRGVLLVAALLATLGIGAAVALSVPRPDPQPAPTPSAEEAVTDTVPEFAIPFRYVVPDGETDTLGTLDGQLPPETMHALLRGQGSLTVFLITGQVHTCEDIAELGGSAEGTTTSTSLGTEPIAFLERLRDDAGVGLGPIRQTMLGNLPAVEAQIDSSAGSCWDVRVHEDRMGLHWATLEPELRGPGTLIVARSQGTTIGALIKATDGESYAEWEPIAREYIDSFEFETAGR